MKCKESSEITAYLQGEGSEEERAMLRRHYEECDSCARELAQFERAFGALGKIETLEPSPDFKDRVQEAFLRAHPQFAPKPRFRLVPAVSIAAAVLLALLGSVVLFRRQPEDKSRMGHLAPEEIRENDPEYVLLPRPGAHEIKTDWKESKDYDARLTLQRISRPRVFDAALWLASRQEKDGNWPAVGEGDKVELTGLCVLASLHGGQTDAARKGLDFLKARQRDSGAIGGGSPVSHAIATLALLEGGDTEAAAKALAVIVTQNQEKPWGDGEVAGWQFHALRLAEAGGNAGVIRALSSGRKARAHLGSAAHAAAMRARLWADPSPDRSAWLNEVRWLLDASPIRGTEAANYSGNDLALAYFGSQLLRPLGGDAWTKWWSPLRTKLEKTQDRDGSWPAGFESGRSKEYATALCALILDTEVRVPPLEE